MFPAESKPPLARKIFQPAPPQRGKGRSRRDAPKKEAPTINRKKKISVPCSILNVKPESPTARPMVFGKKKRFSAFPKKEKKTAGPDPEKRKSSYSDSLKVR